MDKIKRLIISVIIIAILSSSFVFADVGDFESYDSDWNSDSSRDSSWDSSWDSSLDSNMNYDYNYYDESGSDDDLRSRWNYCCYNYYTSNRGFFKEK